RATLERAVRTPDSLNRWYLSVVNELAQRMVVRTTAITGLWWQEIDEPAVLEVIEETMEAIIVVPATVSEDAPTEPHMGEDPSPSQPQPVYPGGGMDAGGSMAPAGDDAPSSQPQPVYPDGMPDDL
ncbi:MAG: hypothetical protein ACERIE_08555, partial [Methyloceanibacter sp.]